MKRLLVYMKHLGHTHPILAMMEFSDSMLVSYSFLALYKYCSCFTVSERDLSADAVLALNDPSVSWPPMNIYYHILVT